MFIQTEPTPNPDTVKFFPGQEVAGATGPFDYPDMEAAATSLMAQALFRLEHVTRVFLGTDFISVTKASDADWQHVKPAVLAAVMDHYVAGLPVIEAGAGELEVADATQYEGEAAEIVKDITNLIDTRVRPAVAQDGGDIVFHRFDVESGAVFLSMRGACAGCPSSSFTLKQGIENMLKAYIPEVTSVEAVL